ncbi:hypothetical protein EXIGLDRAFT_448014 [Exidia glandulosa HHB12029]|uniref:Fungal-type protein kinase domain-containing protein n=1 Tax=Exidia glandulosa HHB12029 TaxID=1314781 RepID=A0A165B536_EXIGL|nr:hypothetical protein EXIGLDRAFT_448014 [Exidia glandulosa HHB12029]
MSSSSHSSSSSYYNSSASSSTSSQLSDNTHATSILEGHVPPEVPLAVFDKIIFGTGPLQLDQLADKLSERYATFARDVAESTNTVSDLMHMLNGISKLYQEHYGLASNQRVEFVEHSHAPLLHHPRKSTSMRPPLIAVSSRVAHSYRSCRPEDSESNAIAWHHVLAAVYTNGSAEDCHPIDRCASFLGALNQARPDMPGSLALTTTRRASCFLWSDAADVYSSHPTAWADSTTLAYLLRFVHRLYEPLAVDGTVKLDRPSYDLAGVSRAEPPQHCREPVWLVGDDKGVEYRIAAVLDVGRPWTHRNWVAVSTQCRAPGVEDFVDCPRKVVKDCWSKITSEDIAESAILEHIHADGDFPGVCRVLSSFLVPGHEGAEGLQSVRFPDLRVEGRRKHRMVLDGAGKDLYTCASILEFLMVMYDVIEVLRRLHEHRGVLHRDISIRNVLLAPDNAGGQGDSKTIRDILAYKYPAVRAEQGPRCVLIDFDNAFWKGKMSDSSLQSAVVRRCRSVRGAG